MYLVDTNVLSVGAPGRRERSAELVDWMNARSDESFVSTVTIAATAASRGLTVLTCNLRHFVPLGIRAANPFETLPETATGRADSLRAP